MLLQDPILSYYRHYGGGGGTSSRCYQAVVSSSSSATAPQLQSPNLCRRCRPRQQHPPHQHLLLHNNAIGADSGSRRSSSSSSSALQLLERLLLLPSVQLERRLQRGRRNYHSTTQQSADDRLRFLRGGGDDRTDLVVSTTTTTNTTIDAASLSPQSQTSAGTAAEQLQRQRQLDIQQQQQQQQQWKMSEDNTTTTMSRRHRPINGIHHPAIAVLPSKDDNVSLLPRHDRHDYDELFDRIVPKYSLVKVDELLKRLEQAVKDSTVTVLIHSTQQQQKKKNKQQRRNNKYKTTVLEKPVEPLPLSTVLQGMLVGTNPNNTLQTQVLQFILGIDSSSNTSTSSTTSTSSFLSAVQQPSSSSSSSNRTSSLSDHDIVESNTETMTTVLFKARERALQNGTCWNTTDACVGSAESRRWTQTRRTQKLQRHQHETITMPHIGHNHAQTILQHLQNSLPTKNYRAICNLFASYVGYTTTTTTMTDDMEEEEQLLGTTPTEKKKKTKSRALGDLYNHLPPETSSSSSSDNKNEEEELTTTATNPMSSSSNNNNKQKPFAIRKLSTHIEKLAGGLHYHLVAQEIAEFFYVSPEHLGVADERHVNSQRRWKEAKDKFVARMMTIQDALHPPQQQPHIMDNINTDTYDDYMDNSYHHVLDDDDNENDEEISQALERKLSGAAAPVHRSQPKIELPRRAHLLFEALPLVQDTSSSSAKHSTHINGFSSNSPVSRMVFVDNLPIDIQETVLYDVFSRCGDVEAVQIFNQRPDLDPGPLSKAQLANRQKRKIQMVGVYNQRWQRPCTPVYALLTFADVAGSIKATDEAVRIFGTIIDRHPVRSIPSSSMTRLYIEGIPDGHPCLDFEYQLGQMLDPDLYVCLDAGQNSRTMVGSCEIKCPSFEIAYESFQKLSHMSLLQEEPTCTLNWIRSPRNATLWWTRKLGFD